MHARVRGNVPGTVKLAEEFTLSKLNPSQTIQVSNQANNYKSQPSDWIHLGICRYNLNKSWQLVYPAIYNAQSDGLPASCTHTPHRRRGTPPSIYTQTRTKASATHQLHFAAACGLASSCWAPSNRFADKCGVCGPEGAHDAHQSCPHSCAAGKRFPYAVRSLL